MQNAWPARLEAALESPEPDGKAGIWEILKQRLNPAEQKPEASPHVVSRELHDRRGPYFILKNQEARTYLRISPTQYTLWQKMNGENTVQDLIVEHYMTTGNFSHGMINRLVIDLAEQQMLIGRQLTVWTTLREKLEKRSILSRLSSPAQFFLTQKLSFHQLDRPITALYRAGGWLLFTRPMQVLYLLLSLGGLLAYTSVIENHEYEFFGSNFIRGAALFWVASILPVIIHELGHALTVKHYGREVPSGGLMLYFGMPAAFVETTDIWMEGRRARLAVTWNGPYTGLILGGTAAIIMHFFPEFPLNGFFFRMAGFAYLTVLINVNPLLKYDGYYLLTDALEISSLRERSLEFVRTNFIRQILDRKRFTRDEWILTIYGLLSILWTVYAIQLVGYLWQSRVQAGFRTLFGSSATVLERLFSFVLAAGALSLFLLLGLGLLRAVQALVSVYVRNAGLTRHVHLALHLAILSAAAGFGLSRIAGGIGLAAAGLAAVAAGILLWVFSGHYRRSSRGAALRVLAVSLAAAGLGETLQLHPALAPFSVYLRWASMGSAVLGGVLLAWAGFGSQIRLPAALGAAGGAITALALRWAGLPDPAALLGGLLALAGIWNTANLYGGARAPAALLVYAGTLLYTFAWAAGQPAASLLIMALLLMSAGAVHWKFAQLPSLSQDESNVGSRRTKEAVRLGVAVIVRRAIAQVYFEAGRNGVYCFGEEFSQAMQDKGLKLSIEGNVFVDKEFEHRTVIELTELYGTAFDQLHGSLCRDFGDEIGSLSFNYGMDRLPWQNREVILELILSRLDWSRGISKQHEDTRARRISFLKRVPLFVTLGEEDLSRISAALKPEQFAAGDVIMRLGDPGDKFYIIERGHTTFWQPDETGQEVRVQEKGAGQFFGEVALVSNAPRNATVLADTPLSVLTLSKADFDGLVSKFVSLDSRNQDMVRRSWLLRSMPIFDELESVELDWLAVLMEQETYPPRTVLFREGDEADRFYIVEKGELIISREMEGKDVEIARAKSGEYVGEIALLERKPRTATISTTEETTVLSLAGVDFLDLISSYSSLGRSVSSTSSRRLSYLQDLGS